MVIIFLWPFLSFSQEYAFKAGTEFTTSSFGTAWNIDKKLNPLAGALSANDSVFSDHILIYGVNESCVNIKCDYISLDTSFHIATNEVVQFQIPILPHSSFQVGRVLPKSIRIKSDYPLIIQQFSGLQFTSPIIEFVDRASVSYSESSTLIPNEVYTNQYEIPLIHSDSPNMKKAQIRSGGRPSTVLTLEDSNQIEISFGQGAYLIDTSSFVLNWLINDTERLDLDIHEAFMLYTEDGFNGLTGQNTRLNDGYVRSLNNKAIKGITSYAIFSDTASSSLGTLYGGLTLEEPLPLSLYPKRIHVAPFEGHKGVLLSIEAIEDSTVVTINNSASILLNKMDRIDSCFHRNLTIESNKSFYSSIQPCLRDDFNNNALSPFLVRPTDESDLIFQSRFKPIWEPSFNNKYYLAVSCPIVSSSNILLDGVPIPSTAFTPYSFDSNWVFATILVDTSQHFVSSTSGFQAYHYSAYSENSSNHFPSYGINLAQDILIDDSLRGISTRLDSGLISPRDSVSLCQGQALEFWPGLAQQTNWSWVFPDTIIEALAQEPVNYVFDWAGFFTIRRQAINSCLSTDSVVVYVQGALNSNINYSIVNNCFENQISLWVESARIPEQIRWLNPSPTSEVDTLVYPLNAASDDVIEFVAEVTDAHCKDTLSIQIPLNDILDPELSFANVITPNGDGINDELCFSQFKGEAECFSVSIFNRNGIAVFESTDPNECWSPARNQAGVYYHVLVLKDKTYHQSITVF